MSAGKTIAFSGNAGGISDLYLLDLATEKESRTEKIRRWKVVFHNDDYTTMEFVVHVLQSIFNHEEAEAQQIMLHEHRKGVGVAGVYTKEVAETKVEQVHALARSHEYPLRCSLEEA